MIKLEDIHIQVDDDAMTASVGFHNPKAQRGQLSVHALTVVEARIFQAIIAEIHSIKEASNGKREGETAREKTRRVQR